MKNKTSSFYNLPRGKCKLGSNRAKDLGPSRKSGEQRQILANCVSKCAKAKEGGTGRGPAWMRAWSSSGFVRLGCFPRWRRSAVLLGCTKQSLCSHETYHCSKGTKTEITLSWKGKLVRLQPLGRFSLTAQRRVCKSKAVAVEASQGQPRTKCQALKLHGLRCNSNLVGQETSKVNNPNAKWLAVDFQFFLKEHIYPVGTYTYSHTFTHTHSYIHTLFYTHALIHSLTHIRSLIQTYKIDLKQS